MSTFKITQDQTSTYNITGTGNTWILKQGVQISSAADGISEPDVLSNNSYVIKGLVSSTGQSAIAISLGGDHSDVQIVGGAVSGNIGIKAYGDNATISNSGTIVGSTAGVQIHGSNSSMTNNGGLSSATGAALNVLNVDHFSFVSDGTMSGATGIHSEAADLSIKLGKHSVIDSSGTTIENISQQGDTAHIVNRGTLSSDGNVFSLVIDGREGKEHVRNSGKIDGSISLGGGDDVYDGRGGKVSGAIAGGAGYDTYILGSKNDFVVEAENDGYNDVIITSFSYKLASDVHVEHLHLSGKGNFNLQGNDGGIFMLGNSGNNRLLGGAGSDILSGGRGKDVLIGGEGVDAFIFSAKQNQEIVRDFVDGVDEISLDLNMHDIKNIHDLLTHHTRQSGDDVVISGDGTEMIIKDFDRGNLTIDDFHIS